MFFHLLFLFGGSFFGESVQFSDLKRGRLNPFLSFLTTIFPLHDQSLHMLPKTHQPHSSMAEKKDGAAIIANSLPVTKEPALFFPAYLAEETNPRDMTVANAALRLTAQISRAPHRPLYRQRDHR